MRISVAQLGLQLPSSAAWTLNAPPDQFALAPLSDWLRGTRRFVRQLLPNSRKAIATINQAIRAGTSVPPSDSTRSRSLYSVVALAVDRGVLHLSGVDIARPEVKRLQSGGTEAKRIAKALARYRVPVRGHFNRPAYLGWLTVLGMLEPVRRGYRPLSDIDSSLLPRRITPDAAAAWFERIIPPDSLEEVAALLRNVRELRLPGSFIANPIFGGIGPVTGADGDWVSGSTLVELKCTVAGAQSQSVAQLICYYVFDQKRAHGHEPFGFDQLALCLPRQGALVHGSADEWLAAFGAPGSAEVVDKVARWFAGT